MRQNCRFLTGMTLYFLIATCLFFGFTQILSTPVERRHPLFKTDASTSKNGADEDSINNMEFVFECTLRSCLSSKCFNEPVGGTINRIGVLSLPGTGVDTFQDFITQKLSRAADLEILFDTHVPAYGYGKNHGWTRIVRFTRSIISHAYYLVNLGGTGDTSADLDRMDAQVT
jgi:hypothetical protein